MTVTVYATDSREFASRYDTEPALWRFRRADLCHALGGNGQLQRYLLGLHSGAILIPSGSDMPEYC